MEIVGDGGDVFSTFMGLHSGGRLHGVAIGRLYRGTLVGGSAFCACCRSVFSLSSGVRDRMISNVMDAVDGPRVVVSRPMGFCRGLLNTVARGGGLVSAMFSNSRRPGLVIGVSGSLGGVVFRGYPRCVGSGGFYALLSCTVCNKCCTFIRGRRGAGSCSSRLVRSISIVSRRVAGLVGTDVPALGDGGAWGCFLRVFRTMLFVGLYGIQFLSGFYQASGCLFGVTISYSEVCSILWREGRDQSSYHLKNI